jgi:uncharacterized protein
MTVIFDCNVLLDASIFKRRESRLSLERSKKADVIIASQKTFEEFRSVSLRSKFDKYVTLESRLEFILEIQALIKLIPVHHAITVCRDPKDDMYLELALSGKADCIVTNDLDLLVLNPFENIPIITPKEFLERFYSNT